MRSRSVPFDLYGVYPRADGRVDWGFVRALARGGSREAEEREGEGLSRA